MNGYSFDPARVFRKLARNNALANQRLHAGCARLVAGELEAPGVSFFPSIRATLNHILILDWFYVDALEGGALGPAAWADAEPFLDLPSLTRAQRAVDLRLLALCEALNADALAATVRVHRATRIQEDRCDDILSHLFQHQTHHRGQAHAMLSGTSVRPPQLDEFIAADDAAMRADDIAAFGWTEADVMR